MNKAILALGYVVLSTPRPPPLRRLLFLYRRFDFYSLNVHHWSCMVSTAVRAVAL